MALQARARALPRWLPIAIALAAILAGAVLEVAWGQTPPGPETLSPDERAIIERNPERWRRMSPEERQRALERYRQWRALPPEDRRAARDNVQHFRALPAARGAAARDAELRALAADEPGGARPRARAPAADDAGRARARATRASQRGAAEVTRMGRALIAALLIASISTVGSAETVQAPGANRGGNGGVEATPPLSIDHVLQRLTYGPRPGDVERVEAMGVNAWLERQLDPARIDDTATERALAPLRTL